MSKAPYLRKSGWPFQHKDDPPGTLRQGMAFMHPCFVEECPNEGTVGVGVRVSATPPRPGTWACREHWHLLDQKPGSTDEPA